MSATPKLVKPIILKRKSLSNAFNPEFAVPTHRIKVIPEQIIYRSKNNDLFSGMYPNLLIVNKLNVSNNTLRTVATYNENSTIILLNSDEVSNVIGSEKYALLLKALDSVTDEKLKIQAILALLTDNRRGKTAHKHCQTLESSIHRVAASKRRIRPNRCRAYVIDSSLDTQTIPDPPKLSTCIKKEPVCKEPVTNHDDLLDLKLLLDDNSNLSSATDGNISLRSCHIPNIPVLLENPISLLETINTSSTNCSIPLKLIDGGSVTLRRKPQDFLHIASVDVLRDLSCEDRRRVIVHQAYIDWKYCLQCDDDGYLPIHIAAMNNDIDLLKRHCAMLISQDVSVDIIGKDSMTALQLAATCAWPAAVAQLLRRGADVRRRDERERSVLHLAADASVECVDVIVEFCRANARKILQEEEDLWKPGFEAKSDDELVQYLLDELCCLCDDSGNTALMLASVKGDHAAVTSLLAASPKSVHVKMPTNGNTALNLVFQTAFIEAEEAGNKKLIAQNYLEIIETLHAYGADPTVTNDAGYSVAMLAADYKVDDLTQAIVNKLLKSTSEKKSFDSYMLVKGKAGDLNVELVTPGRKRSDSKVDAGKDEKCVKKTVVFFRPVADGNTDSTVLQKDKVATADTSEDIKIKRHLSLPNHRDRLGQNVTIKLKKIPMKLIKPVSVNSELKRAPETNKFSIADCTINKKLMNNKDRPNNPKIHVTSAPSISKIVNLSKMTNSDSKMADKNADTKQTVDARDLKRSVSGDLVNVKRAR